MTVDGTEATKSGPDFPLPDGRKVVKAAVASGWNYPANLDWRMTLQSRQGKYILETR